MIGRFKINSLKRKIIIVFIVISAIVLILHLVIFQHWISAIIQEKSDSYFQETVRQIGKRVEMQYKQIDDDVQKIHNNQVIKNYLKDLKYNKMNYTIAKYKITNQALGLSNLDMIENIYIFLANDLAPMNLFYSSPIFNVDQNTKEIMRNFAEHNADHVMWSTKTSPIQNTVKMYIYDDELLGLLKIDFNESLFNQMDEVQLGKGGSIYLVKDHNIIFSKDRTLINKPDTNLSQIEGTKVRYGLDYQGWELIGVVPQTEISNHVQQVNKVLLVMVFVILAAIFTFAIVTARLILKPLNKILGGMEKVQEGNLDVILENKENDEYSEIIHHFNYMVEKVNTLVETVYQQQHLYRKAEMINLQSKLNPHFLYNTLDMIYWMLIIKDEEEVGDVVQVLSNILRYSISHQDEVVTVGEDMYQLDNYLQIQRMRFEDKLQYTFDIDPAITEMKIPKLLIQPLIENSIKYAFNDMKYGGKIQVLGYEDQTDLLFEVIDNGGGMSEDQIQLLYKRMNNKEEGESGLGIRLVHQRIQYIYGEKYGVTIDSSQGEGTKITVRLKKKAYFEQEKNENQTDVGHRRII